MPINPIDLQTNFSQINQVGKQQNQIKESENMKESYISGTIQKNSEGETRDVPVTKEISDGPGKIKDEKRKKKQFDKNKKNDEKDLEEKKEEDETSIVHDEIKQEDQDKLIGKHIDIVG